MKRRVIATLLTLPSFLRRGAHREAQGGVVKVRLSKTTPVTS